MKSINALYRWNMLTIERLNLLSLRSRSSGVEQAMYRALLQSCTEEMEQLTPLLVEIFKHIKKYSVMQDIIAIYFEDQRYQDWADSRGVTAEAIYLNISSVLEEVDREIEQEAA